MYVTKNVFYNQFTDAIMLFYLNLPSVILTRVYLKLLEIFLYFIL